MPSFLDYQEKARKRTRLFVALHILCVAAIAFLVGALALATMWLVEGDGSDSIPRAFVDARLGLRQVFADQDALAEGQTVRL